MRMGFRARVHMSEHEEHNSYNGFLTYCVTKSVDLKEPLEEPYQDFTRTIPYPDTPKDNSPDIQLWATTESPLVLMLGPSVSLA